jgi:hypothetical protein
MNTHIHFYNKTRFSRAYDFQRALCEDPVVINEWFRLVSNMRAKYGILDCDFYNFDETGFMMGMICPSMVVTRSDRRGKSKQVQPGNREWATAITCVSGDGFDVPPFLLVQGLCHLASWYTEGGIPDEWAIKPTSNGWTDNETGLDWIKHFDKHTKARTKGGYRMLVLTGTRVTSRLILRPTAKSTTLFLSVSLLIPPTLPSRSTLGSSAR